MPGWMENLPATQSTHSEFWLFACFPFGHVLHRASPCLVATFPDSHCVHCVAVRAADPGGQGSHRELDALDTAPAGHGLQSDAPTADAKLPA